MTYKGHYSIVQYCDDLSRMECVNIGVLLLCPERNFARAKMSASNDRVRKFFGSEIDLTQIEALKASIEERFEVESFHTLEQLQAFIGSRGNEVQLTAPRAVKVTDPDQDLENLFHRLVGGVSRHRSAPAKKELDRYLRRPELEPKLERDVTVSVPTFHSTLTVPYGYQNGRFNLILPARFEGISKEAVVTRACRMGVEGESLHDVTHPKYGQLRLVVVGFFSGAQAEERQICEEIFKRNEVHLFTSPQKLADEIRENGKPLAEKAQTTITTFASAIAPRPNAFDTPRRVIRRPKLPPAGES